MKKLVRKASSFKGFTIGLDLHKKFVEFCVLNERGDEVESGRFDSTRENLLGFIGKWKKRGALQTSLEACGCFVWVFDLLSAELTRERVHVGQPSRIHVIANSMEKNDSNDAWWLAYLLYEGRLPESYVVEGALRDLRIASRELRSYTDQRGDLLRRLKSHFAQTGIKVPKSWQASKVGRTKMKALIAEVQGERRRALEILFKQIRQVGKQMLYWRSRVEALSRGLPAVEAIKREMPGFGTIISGAVIGELGAPERFYNEKAYAKATGLTPGYRQSGGQGMVVGITRAGSRLARWGYTRAVIGCLRCKQGAGKQIRQWVEERSRHKPKKKVIVAAARKLAEGVWRLFALGEAFNLARAFPVKSNG